MKKLLFALLVSAQLVIASDNDLDPKEVESDILSTLSRITKKSEGGCISYVARWTNGDTDCAWHCVTGSLREQYHCTRSFLRDDGGTDTIPLLPSHYAFLKKLYESELAENIKS